MPGSIVATLVEIEDLVMSEAAEELRRSNDDDRQGARAGAELRREAYAQIKSGIRQLFAGLAVERIGVGRRLSQLGRVIVILLKVAIPVGILACLAVAAVMLWALYTVPLQSKSGVTGPSLLVEAANGEPLGRIGPLADNLKLSDFPEILIKAVVSVEDRRFYDHRGVDLWAIGRAVYANWTAGGVVEGGSTITQQLAKMQVVGNERTLSRKLREACTAVWLELRLEKDEILTRYLNTVYLGSGVHGMSAAARAYFDKNVGELTLPEAAMLAGLIQAPSKNNPARNLEAAQQRAGDVIDAMLQTGAIDAAAASKAKAEPALLNASARTVRAGTWFADWIAKYEVPKIAGTGGRALRVRTTLQPQLQQLAEQTLNDALANPDEAHGTGQAALVAMRPDGSVVAMVGGRNYAESEFNRAVDAQRQPGSAFKLVVYYAALRKGMSPDSTIDASPIEINGWEPENYGGQEFGKMTLSRAFAQSVNSAAIRLSRDVGLDEVVAAARELGLDTPLAKVPSMALGTNEVNLLDLTGAFASVRAAHPRLEPWGIAAFGQEGGGLRSLSPPETAAQELPQHQEMTRLLREVVERGTGRAAKLDEGEAAGKTGTSQEHRDAWFVGFNQALVVGVWVGNDDHSPMQGVTGGSLPALIWRRFVTAATPLIAERNEPPAPVQESPVTSAIGTPTMAATEPANPPAQCDKKACAAKYSSFRESDCTYKTFYGQRRLCGEGAGEFASGKKAEAPAATTAPARGDSCDRDRCARQYKSFDAATCTYQPHDGGPRLKCDKGL
jgi:penicillin-binding protein 1A